VAGDTVEGYFGRDSKLSRAVSHDSFDKLVSTKDGAFVVATRLGTVATTHNLNAAFNALLDELELKTGADWARFTVWGTTTRHVT
jgi:integrase